MMPKKFRYVISFTALFLLQACGIKGAPIPPQKPFFIGNGEKRIKSASEEQSNFKKIDEKKNKNNNKEKK